MPSVSIALETWNAIADEVLPLATAHAHEVDGGIEPRRRFALDTVLLDLMCKAGYLKILTARVEETLVGYYTWNITPDVESAGLVIAQQGAWFVSPGAPVKTASLLYNRSITELRRLGVACIFPHHRSQGRGKGLGKHFVRSGAKPIQTTYCLWIGV